jgi:hypothetical protein
VRGAEAIRAGVAAADDHHVLVLGGDGAWRVALALLVGRHQVFHGQVHALEVPALDLVIPGSQRANGQHHGVVLSSELLDRQVDADLSFGDETGSLGAHLGQPLVQRSLLELVLGNAVAHQAADAVVALVDGDVVAGSRELLCGSQSRGSGADDGDVLAG